MDPRIRFFGLTIALTAIFHVTLARYQFGYSFVIFILAYLLAFHLALWQEKPLTNRWAYLFLIPVLAAVFNQSWYAADATRALSFILTPIALAFFSYWATAPARSLASAFSLTSWTLVRETILPFQGYRDAFPTQQSISQRTIWQIIVGLAAGFPILWIVTLLFSAADHSFAQVIDRLFGWSIAPDQAGRFILDLFVGLFLLGFLWTIRRRLYKAPVAAIISEEKEPHFPDRTAFHTFLIVLNAIFILFVSIQVVYAFQGASHWALTDLTYADYAKQSFYQLFWVACIVLGIVFFGYTYAGMRVRLTRGLLLFLIAQTGVVLLSAWARLILYISTYGLTVLRWIGGVSLCMTALLLGWCGFCLLRRLSVTRLWQGSILSLFLATTPLFLINHEGTIAYYNISHLSNNHFDLPYLLTLSSDVVPALIDLNSKGIPAGVSIGCKDGANGNDLLGDSSCLKEGLLQKNERLILLRDRDWRLLVRSDHHAFELLSQK